MIGPVVRHIVLAAGILLGSHAALAENRVALVIGQSNYRAVVPLPNPANDAKAVSQMLTESGFEVLTAADLSQNELRAKVGDFAAKVAAKGPDTVALVFYAGHGLQIDGENFLVPVDVDPKRETDIPLQAVRLNDILNTLASVPSKTRILLLDSCRNNPFPDISKTAARRARHRRRQDRRSRHLHVVLDIAGRRSRGWQRRQQPLHHGAARGGQGARTFDRGYLQARARCGQQGDRGAADALGQFLADRRLQVCRSRCCRTEARFRQEDSRRVEA